MSANTQTLTAPKSANRMLLLLAAVFVLPFVVGSGLFWLDWRPAKFGNYGDLVQPPRALPTSGLVHANGRPFPTSELIGKWLLVLPLDAPCNARCAQTLQQMLHVHTALNREQARVQRVLLYGKMIPDPETATLPERFPDLAVAAVANTHEQAWQGALSVQDKGLYVVDPLGNVMLHYADPTNMRGVLKDLERLLKYSWIR